MLSSKTKSNLTEEAGYFMKICLQS